MDSRPFDRLLRGVRVGGYLLRISRVSPGRLAEERNYVLELACRGEARELMYVKVFGGRLPYYRPWVEVFNISSSFTICGRRFSYFGSVVEDVLLDLLAGAVGPGERLFVEYYGDYETARALELGVPAPLTRLGYKLFLRGFRWFKDWYFPEGFMEGGPKLQAEKPLSRVHEQRLLDKVRREVENFVREYASARDGVVGMAVRRAYAVLELIERLS